jgi:hypothetical protein
MVTRTAMRLRGLGDEMWRVLDSWQRHRRLKLLELERADRRLVSRSRR